nr:Chain A, 3-dehydroquinate dehydratase [Zymomonas mobilis subsp. mobilis ZM4 = ATCC 31821]6SMF_B Chain B, 3-dehydroquinate dehydratase [Zymomonas mobilis subsp. mobilis ZM4 = ATCC 31821]6SMF_C Chain C, 3-dehydroquinate dehydratase [Zymomonas mobilis subsp. mobilis ZM4 = ATCC 31821]6SMF_D Chain D, 3-dehydroquinate dehydratase [Zymomonas mobilis subsp. mobilis ZM4 = ATCC 31821]
GSHMAKKPTIFILNGPNLNLLGLREPTIYGHQTLEDIANKLKLQAEKLDVTVEIRQSNHEGALIDWLQEAQAVKAKAVILNAAAYTHTSVAIYDAIRAITVPVIEVHLSNPHAREAFRHKSYVGEAALGTISGFGAESYSLALDAAAKL